MSRLFSLLGVVWLCMAACTHAAVDVQLPDDCNGLVPSFRTQVQPILQQSCAKAGCHDGNSMPHDFSVYSELKPVLDDSSFYYYVIKDRKMPQDTVLDSVQYRLIKCWLRNGYPDN